MSGKWTVWKCCSQFEIHDSKEEAFSWAHGENESDSGHRAEAIEDPNGEDLTEEFEAYDREQSRLSSAAYAGRRDDAKRLLVGSVDVRSPSGDWCKESVYSEDERDKLLAEMRETFGSERVRFVAASGVAL